MREAMKSLRKDNSGATAVEYGLILAMIFLAMVASVQSMGNQVMSVWEKVSTDSSEAIDQASI